MRLFKTSLLVLCILSSVIASAQRFYVTFKDSLIKVNLTPAGCVSTPVKMCASEQLYSIALYKDTLYHLRNERIFRSVLKGTQISGCEALATLPMMSPSSLTVDSTGILYLAGEDLFYTFNPNTGRFDSLGVLPYKSAGDLIFFKSSLYMASVEGIVKIDLANVASSKLIIPSSDGVFGLASLSLDCKENKVYAFKVINDRTTDIIELDLEQNKMNGVACTLPYPVWDAASNVEGGNLADIPLNRIEVSVMCNNAPKAQIKVAMEPGITSYTFSLDGGSGTPDASFADVSPGHHTLAVSTPSGCRIDTSFEVPAFNMDKPVIAAHKEEVNCAEGGKIWFTTPVSTSLVQVLLVNDTFPLSHVFHQLPGGNYYFRFINQYNCPLDSMTVSLANTPFCDTLYFPNAFTPNGDNRNDVFKGAGNYSIRNYKLTVFNRWGSVVFTSSNLEKGWDGTCNGKEQPAGTFVWLATYETAPGKRKTQKNVVTLWR